MPERRSVAGDVAAGTVPFVPLEAQLSSQETYEIRHPEFAIVLPSRLILGFPEADRTVTYSLIHVTRVRELAPAG